MLKNVSDLNSDDFSKGLNTNPNIFSVSKDQSPNMVNVKIHIDGSISKRLGSQIQNANSLSGAGPAGFTSGGGALTDGLQAFWDMNSTGDRNDNFDDMPLTDNNNTGVKAGIIGNAASFVEADSNFLSRATTAGLETGDIDFSINTWVYLENTGEYTIISKGENNVTGGIDSNTILMLHLDGEHGSKTFTDDSDSARAVIESGGTVAITTANSVFGGAGLSWNGLGQYLMYADNVDFEFGAGDFTIDFHYRVGDNDGQFLMSDSGETDWILFYYNQVRLVTRLEGSSSINFSSSWNQGQWYHIALTRQGSTLRCFQDGVQIGSDVSNTTNILSGANAVIGRSPNNPFVNSRGDFDEFRIVKGKALYTSNFTVPNRAYARATDATEREYWLKVDTDSIVSWNVSSSGIVWDGTVRATSFGALSTATWYNVQCYHDTGNFIGVCVNLSETSASYTSGVRLGSAPFLVGALSSLEAQTNGIALQLNGRVDETSFYKTLFTASSKIELYNAGNGITYAEGFPTNTWGSFDFGASDIRWVVFAAGTGLYASSDLGVNFTTMATDRTATYQHFERSKNILVATSDEYDTPLKWDGSGGTFATVLNPSAPLARFSINHQGFLILLNTDERKRAFYYEDVNTQVTGDWADVFDIPSSQDDEITGAIILRKNLYVSTRYKIYRVSFVGGNPDWSFSEVKDWGYVPRTIKKLTLKDIGEVVIGMDWDRKMRLFDGADDKFISDNVEEDNRMSEFAFDKVSFSGSGLKLSHAVVDSNEQEYRLVVALGKNSTETTDTINFSGRTLSFFPYNNTPLQTMVMAESANARFLLAGDRSGFVHLMNSGNLDAGATAIDDHYDSPFIFEKSPSEVSKNHRIDMYFQPNSSGTIFIQERVDFADTFTDNDEVVFDDTGGIVQLKKDIDVNSVQNVYQWRITSKSNQAVSWRLNRIDYLTRGLGIGNNP